MDQYKATSTCNFIDALRSSEREYNSSAFRRGSLRLGSEPRFLFVPPERRASFAVSSDPALLLRGGTPVRQTRMSHGRLTSQRDAKTTRIQETIRNAFAVRISLRPVYVTDINNFYSVIPLVNGNKMAVSSIIKTEIRNEK